VLGFEQAISKGLAVMHRTLSAAALALFAFGTAQAQEAIRAATVPDDAAAREHQDRAMSEPTYDGSLLTQAKAVLAALRARREVEEQVRASDDASVATVLVDASAIAGRAVTAAASECRLMPMPGSRIMKERCYYPSDGERVLNDQQFREELRYMRDATIREQIERDAAEAIRRQQRGRFL
jgi:hypothetical protein